jgi:hypothetical protein
MARAGNEAYVVPATAGPLAILMTSPAALIEGKYRFLGHDELLYS